MKIEPAPHIKLYEFMFTVPVEPHRFDEEVSQIPQGLVLEFGVGEGKSIEKIRTLTGREVYGFDSFEGLPEDWDWQDPKGKFKCDPPQVSEGIHLIKGMFQDTLDDFLKEHQGPVALCHIDCDLYSSTSYVLPRLKDRFIPGSLLIFDEILMLASIQHELKAFYEYLVETQQKWICHARYNVGEAALFRMEE